MNAGGEERVTVRIPIAMGTGEEFMIQNPPMIRLDGQPTQVQYEHEKTLRIQAFTAALNGAKENERGFIMEQLRKLCDENYESYVGKKAGAL